MSELVLIQPEVKELPQKWCYVCERYRTIDNFWKNKTRTDGYCYICKDCRRTQLGTPKRIYYPHIFDIHGFERKRCPTCKKYLRLDYFHNTKSTKDGLTCYCKMCLREYNGYKLRPMRAFPNRFGVDHVELKYCHKCEEWKVLDLFYKATDRVGGYRSLCKACVAIRGKKWNEANKEYVQERNGVFSFLYGGGNGTRGYLNGDGCCVWCGEYNPFMLHEHHIFGRKENDTLFTFCADHHELFRRGGIGFEFLAEIGA